MEILRVENLSFRYPKAEGFALKDMNLSVQSGEFLVLCGPSGCGKTTLLRLLKKELSPAGELSGRVLYGADAPTVGFVGQNPEAQTVTDKVWHELAFGLESLGLPTEVIRRRVGEMACFFGIEGLFRKRTDELSGGQKQLLCLASVLVMQPQVILLDEPTGQLDPIAASDFIAALQKINRELGITVILAEHRLEDVFPVADRAAVMEDGQLLLCCPPRDVAAFLSALDGHHAMLRALPSAARIWQSLRLPGDCPLTVREGRELLERHCKTRGALLPEEERAHADDAALELKSVFFRYERDAPDVLRGASFTVYRGVIFCVLGGNGAGKTTLLNVAAGLDRAYRGKVSVFGKPVKDYKGGSLYRHCLALLPQDPQCVFAHDTVRADLYEMCEAAGIKKAEREERVREEAERLGVSHLLERHPYDLSGGEMQKCALAKVLLSAPKLLLLDEPTKGIDAFAKQSLCGIIKDLQKDGITAVIVTHDVEFAAESADRCALVFDGEILSADTPRRFFAENSFYTTAANRIARTLWKNAVSCAEVSERFLAEGEDG